VFAYNNNTPVLQFQIPETFTVPGIGPDTLENPQGFAVDMNHVYVMDAGPDLGTLHSNAWFKFERDGTPVLSSKATGLTAALQPHFDAFGDAIVDGMTWIPDDAPYGQGLFLVAVEHTGFLVLDANGEAVDELIWQEEDIPFGEATPFAFAGVAIDPNTGDLYLVENSGAAMHVWIRLDPAEDQLLVYNLYGNHIVWPDTRCARRTIIPTQSNQFSLTYRNADGLLWTNEFNSGSIITIDPRSGKQNTRGPSGVNDVWGMAYDTERDVIYMYAYESPSDSGRIHVLDPVTLNATPLPIASGTINDMAFNGNDRYIYATTGFGGDSELVRIDRDTGIASPVGSLPTSGALAWEPFEGALMMIGGNPRTLYAVDPATALSLELNVPPPGGSAFEGLAAIPVPADPVVSVPRPATRSLAMRVRPNPTSGASRIEFALAAPERLSARVFDVAGRIVRTLADDQDFGSGSHSLAWDGRGSDGASTRAGIYFVVVNYHAGRSVARVAVVR
jgi:hypothetical protein